MKTYLYPADIYLPDFAETDGSKWACVACDQFTSEKDYWDRAYSYVGDEPSALKLMLPEAYLDRDAELIPKINAEMENYLNGGTLKCHQNTMIYLERTQSDGRIRRGIVAAVDLEDYDYTASAETLIRATEGTVIERIPPRVKIRRGASLEMPHIMVLIDDPEDAVTSVARRNKDTLEKAYDIELWGGGGRAVGYFVPEEYHGAINTALAALATGDEMVKKYGVSAAPLLYAMGDGNHSLATAKALYEEIKAELGDAALTHPARYALCEIVNVHDEALDFEPIYRVVFGVDEKEFYGELCAYISSLEGSAEAQTVTFVSGDGETEIEIPSPVSQLAVGTIQAFLDAYVKAHPEAEVDYIHGEDSVRALAAKDGCVGILYGGMEKSMLFKTVLCDGALPRKTFSMGHAEDKRYYIECRKIK